MEWLDTLAQLLNITLVFSTALMFTALGGIFSERSGVINIGLEGLMISGAFASAITAYYLEQIGLASIGPWVALLAAMACSMIFALLHAIASITFKANQVVSGVVINLLSLGLTVFLVKVLFDGSGETKTIRQAVFTKWEIPILSDIPFLGYGLFTAYPTTYIAIILVFVAYYVLWKTPFGLRLRSVGEHPGASDTLGINVTKMRYIAVLISGALGGLGGATITLTTTANFTHNTISGQGFIALAAVIFGKWHPFGILGSTMFFGMATGLKNFIQFYDWSKNIPNEFIYMIPYVLTILVLAGFVGRATSPSALGEPYDPSKR